MTHAYIYMECPLTQATVTLGRLSIQNGKGAFRYSPEALEQRFWVPDPVRFPLQDREFVVTKNDGVPGFILDAMPDGWGERLLSRLHGSRLSKIELLLKSPNTDRSGGIMSGTSRHPPEAVGQKGIRPLEAKFLDAFLLACQAIYDSSLTTEQIEALKIRDQRSSAGGARPKRTFRGNQMLILAKPKDKYDDHDFPAIEHACMSFAGSKGLNVAKTSLHIGKEVKTLLVERFDRVYDAKTDHFHRVPMLSALTLLNAEWKSADHSDWHYAAFANELYRRGAAEDRPELFKRMAYNALVGNADDHPRNHAVIWQAGRWRLSPMYDVMPILGEGPAQTLSMAVGRQGTAITRANMLSECQHFGLTEEAAAAILDEVASWDNELKTYYGAFLAGADLDAAVATVSGARLRA